MAEVETETSEPVYDTRTEVVHPLKFPFERRYRPAGGGGEVRVETVDTITIRRIKGKQLRAIEKMAGKGEDLAMISMVTDLGDKAVDELDAVDILDITEIVKGFLPRGALTGKTD